MSNQSPIRKGQAGQPTPNNGHFAQKTHDTDDVRLAPAPRSAINRYSDVSAEVFEKQRELHAVAIDVFRESLPKVYPGAVRAKFSMLHDFDGSKLSLDTVYDGEGNELDAEPGDDNGDIEFACNAFEDSHDVRGTELDSDYDEELGDYRFTLDLNAEPPAPGLWAAEALARKAKEKRAAAELDEFNAGALGLHAIAHAVSADATGVRLRNTNEEGGAPCLVVDTIMGKDGTPIWTNPDYSDDIDDDSEDSQKVAEQTYKYAPLLDRDMSRLTQLTQGWGPEQTWSFTF